MTQHNFFEAYFYTEADWAQTTIKAKTPELALRRARQIESEKTETLNFQSYDGEAGVERIEIQSADGSTVAEWRSEDLLVRLAAQDLLEVLESQTDAAQAVINNWSEGDLAAAVRGLDGSIEAARAAIAKTKSREAPGGATRIAVKPKPRRKPKNLPPDPENMNDNRAEWAAAALRHFQCCTGTDYDTALLDLLCDLMHWCDRNGFNFAHELGRAHHHYEAETAPAEVTA